jgi:hypothetical protein
MDDFETVFGREEGTAEKADFAFKTRFGDRDSSFETCG